MTLDFVNREQLVRQLTTLVQVASPKKRLALLDSPAGMGKTYLLIKICRELIEHTHEQSMQPAWKIIRLDFRNPARQYSDRRDILEDIARQICRDIRWANIRDLIGQARKEDEILIKQATSIPLANEDRQALLDAVQSISSDNRDKIRGLIVEAFDSVDLQELRQQKGFADPAKQVAVLVEFILRKRTESPKQHLIPDNILIVFDSLDAISDETMRNWVISELALWLHDGLQMEFERFFVIVAGRFIEQGLSHDVKERYNTGYVLEPFVPEDVEELIRQFGDRQFNRKQQLVSRLAKKLSQVCGGHPKVIKDIALQLYNRPRHFSALVTDPRQAGYWYNNPLIGIRPALKTRRDKAVNSAVGVISRQQRLALELLSVFRSFNSVTLETLCSKIQDNDALPQTLHQYRGLEENVDNLFDGLLKTRLIWEGGIEPLYSGRIVLGLMAAQMQEQQPELFCLLNKWATEIFQEWVVWPYPGVYQRIYVCEWLFHRLCVAEHCKSFYESCLDKRCKSMQEAPGFGEQILQELKSVLSHVLPFQSEPNNNERRKKIRGFVEKDQQIDHLIWEIAVEDPGQYKKIRERILSTLHP